MEGILKDIGLSGYAQTLRDYNYSYRYFISILRANHNAPQMRHNVMQDCGMSNADVIAILDRIQDNLNREERSLRGGPLTPPQSSKMSKSSKRISALLKQPNEPK